MGDVGIISSPARDGQDLARSLRLTDYVALPRTSLALAARGFSFDVVFVFGDPLTPEEAEVLAPALNEGCRVYRLSSIGD